jgi:hypothetical protein
MSVIITLTSVIITLKSVISTSTRLISTRRVRFPHREFDFTRQLWFLQTREKVWLVCVWIMHSEMYLRALRTRVICTRKVCNTHKCDYDTHECIFYRHECDNNTQSVISTRIVILTRTNVITTLSTRTRVISTRISMLMTHTSVKTTRKIVIYTRTSWISTRCVWLSHEPTKINVTTKQWTTKIPDCVILTSLLSIFTTNSFYYTPKIIFIEFMKQNKRGLSKKIKPSLCFYRFW